MAESLRPGPNWTYSRPPLHVERNSVSRAACAAPMRRERDLRITSQIAATPLLILARMGARFEPEDGADRAGCGRDDLSFFCSSAALGAHGDFTLPVAPV